MDRNDCDISTTCNWKSWLSDLCHESYMANGSHSAVSEIAGSRHTLACSLSKLRSSIEAGKKQLRVWLQYVWSVTEMLLYPSFGVGFNPTFLTLGRANAFVLHSLNRKVPLVLLLSPYGDSEMARSGFEDGSKWRASDNICSCVIKAGFVASRTCVRRAMNYVTFLMQ